MVEVRGLRVLPHADRVQGVVKVNGGEVDQRFLGIKKQLNGDKDRVENLVHKEFYKGSDYLKNSDLIMQMFHKALGKEAYAKLENMRGQTITEITLKSNNLRINVGGIGNEKLNDRIESGDNQDKDFKWATCLYAYGNRKMSKEAVVNILKKVFGINLMAIAVKLFAANAKMLFAGVNKLNAGSAVYGEKHVCQKNS